MKYHQRCRNLSQIRFNKRTGAQRLQEDCAEDDCALPAGQSSQEGEPRFADAVPLPHGVHTLFGDAIEEVRTVKARQEELEQNTSLAFFAAKNPRRHWMQVEALVPL
jgi:hypothetical protein